jgi:hypothetical protein
VLFTYLALRAIVASVSACGALDLFCNAFLVAVNMLCSRRTRWLVVVVIYWSEGRVGVLSLRFTANEFLMGSVNPVTAVGQRFTGVHVVREF